jgi:hypothetical protein
MRRVAVLVLTMSPGCSYDALIDGLDGDGIPSAGACLDPATARVLADHVDDLGQSGAMLLGHASPSEAVSSFLFPGYPGVVANYASLIGPCQEELTYHPWCDGELCWQIECTGDGADHVTHAWLAFPPLEVDGFVLETAAADTTWDEVTGDVTLTLDSVARSPDGADVSVEGTSVLHPHGTLELVEHYPGLVEGGAELAATLDVTAAATTGYVAAGGVLLAEWSGHDLVVVEPCE